MDCFIEYLVQSQIGGTATLLSLNFSFFCRVDVRADKQSRRGKKASSKIISFLVAVLIMTRRQIRNAAELEPLLVLSCTCSVVAPFISFDLPISKLNILFLRLLLLSAFFLFSLSPAPFAVLPVGLARLPGEEDPCPLVPEPVVGEQEQHLQQDRQKEADGDGVEEDLCVP